MDIKFNEELMSSLVDRTSALSGLLKTIEDQLVQIDFKKIPQEDLLVYYGLVSKNEMAMLEFIRKMMLLPEENPIDDRLKTLVSRLMSLPETSLKQLEKRILELEGINEKIA